MSRLAPAMSLVKPHSVSPGSIAPAPMVGTALLPTTAMTSISHAAPMEGVQSPSWSVIPGSASQVTGSPDGSIWALASAPSGADKYIWHYVSGTWTNIPGLAAHLAAAPDGTLFALNSSGGIYSWNGTWTAFAGGASAISVASDSSLYVLSNAHAGGNQAIWHYAGGAWTQLPGAGVAIAASWDPRSYVTPGGTIVPGGFYILNSQGYLYYGTSAGNSYTPFSGAASAIAPSTIGGIYVLSYPADTAAGNQIYYYNLDAPGWTAQSGAGISLSVGGSTYLYVVSTSGAIYSSPVTMAAPPPIGSITEYPLAPYSSPQGITAGSDGNLWFTEISAGKIGSITPGGTITEYSLPALGANPSGITAGPDGDLWFTDDGGAYNRIGKISPSGVAEEFAQQYANSAPNGIVAGPDGNLWFTEYNADAVGLISTAGNFGAGYDSGPAAYGSAPYGIAVGADGNLWFTESQANKIGRITTRGTITEYTIPTAYSQPRDIAAGPDGDMWFTEYSGNNIGRIATSGTIIEYSLPSVPTGSMPNGIAAGPDGNLWFTEYGGNNIGTITTGGVITEYPIPTAYSQPGSIAAGPDGNMWFTESGVNKIGKIRP